MSNSPNDNSVTSASRETRPSVLSGMRLSKDDGCRLENRELFFKTYQPLLFVFFRRRLPNDHDAEDLASDLIAKLLKRMDAFEYDPRKSFRAYLYTVARHALQDFWDDRNKRHAANVVDLEQYVSEQELQDRIEEQFDLELLEKAKERVRGQVSGRDWDIYVRLTESLITPADLAAELGVNRHTVDGVKNRVLNRIRTEVRS